MDTTSIELLTTIIIDLILLTILLGFFIPVKNARSHPDAIGKTPPYCERTSSVPNLVYRVYRANEEEIIRSCTPEGLNYLSNIKVLAALTLVLCFIGLTVLFPIYSQGTSDTTADVNNYAVEHILSNIDYLWVVVFCWVFFTVLFYCAVGYYLHKVSSIAAFDRYSITNQAVQLGKLPLTRKTDELQELLVEFFARRFPGSVLTVYVVPDITDIYILEKRLKEVRAALHHSQVYLQLRNKRPMIKGFCKSEDAIDKHTAEIEAINQQIENLRPTSRDYSLGCAFVVFRHPRDAEEFLQLNIMPEPNTFGFNYWVVRQAPDPSDIVWENKHTKMVYNLGLRFVIEGLFFVVFLILLTPTSMFQLINDLFDGLGLRSVFKAVLSAYLPSLIPMLIQSIILPEAITLVVDLERHSTKSKALNSRLFKFLALSMFYIVLVPMLGVGVYELVRQLFVDSSSSYTKLFAEKLVSTGVLFTLYIINITILGFGLDLLQIPKVFKVYWARWQAVSVDEALKAYDADELDQAQQYAKNVTTAGIVLCFSIVFPLILVFGALFFLLRFVSQKYNILCYYHIEFIGRSYAVPHTIVKWLMVYLFIFQVLNAGVLMLSEDISLLKIGGAFIVTAFILLVSSLLLFNWVVVRKLSKEHMRPLLDPKPMAYMHPADWKTPQELARL